jgi:hypothetical protein
MSDRGSSYNSLKGASDLHMPRIERIGETYTYVLPPEEIAAKYFCIALYNGRFRISALSRLLKTNAKEYFAEELSWLLNHGYVRLEKDFCQVTEAGFRYYGAIGALFWSTLHKTNYLKERTAQ